MKIKEGFKMRSVLGESVIVGEGIKQINFSKIISLNETAAFIWQAMEGGEFSVDNLANALQETYEISPEQARQDVTNLLNEFREQGLIED